MRMFAKTGFVFCLLAMVTISLPAHATKIEVIKSPGGLTAWLVHEPAIPIISLRLSFKGGGALDPEGQEGLANLVSGLLDEGAGELESLAFQTRLKELSIRLGFDADRDDFFVNLSTLSRNQDAAFELLKLALTAPRFDSGPVERVRQQVIVGLTRDLEDSRTIAGRNLFKTVFDGHPYWHSTDGSIDSVKSITSEDLGSFVRRRFARDNILISVVGDITGEALGPLLDRTLGDLPARAAPATVPKAEPNFTTDIKVIRRPVPQSTIYLGMPGIMRDDPDWYTAHLMNYVLGGGGLTSRLTEEVREKRGLAYSAYSYLLPYDHAGLYIGGAGTQNSRVVETLETIKAVFVRMRDQGISEQELQDAKTYINGSFPLRLTSSGRIAGLLLAMQRNNLGNDYLDRRADIYNRITREDVQRIAKRLLRPEMMYVVIVGDPEGLGDDG